MTNIGMNSTRRAPPDTMCYGTNSKLIDTAIQPGRIGYVPRTQRSKGRLENRGDKCMLVGYANDHARDTYRMLNLRTNGLCETKHVTWADFEFEMPDGRTVTLTEAETPGIPDYNDLAVSMERQMNYDEVEEPPILIAGRMSTPDGVNATNIAPTVTDDEDDSNAKT